MNNSSGPIIETRNLRFGFSKKEMVLRNVNLIVEKGSIYGFLGLNGAGKTTTIKLLLGLLRAPENNVRLFGKDLHKNRVEILSEIGSLIEHPSLYEHISGYDNLQILCLVRKLHKRKIADVLEVMGLSAVAGRKVSEYSMGMKQRLGVAAALIGDPELLILDEPVNGLDPNGIVEMRELLKDLNKNAGVTIFLSSHLLSEIEKLVTHIGIINLGESIFQGTINELRELQKNARFCLHIETSNNEGVYHLLKSNFNVTCNGTELIVICSTRDHIASVINIIVNSNIDVYRVFEEDEDLEHLYMKMIKEKM